MTLALGSTTLSVMPMRPDLPGDLQFYYDCPKERMITVSPEIFLKMRTEARHFAVMTSEATATAWAVKNQWHVVRCQAPDGADGVMRWAISPLKEIERFNRSQT